MKKPVSVRAWAPETIYLTRDGYDGQLSEDGEILWCEDRITSGDVEYRRVTRPKKRKGE
jgi:hypothetical protein